MTKKYTVQICGLLYRRGRTVIMLFIWSVYKPANFKMEKLLM